MCRRPFAICESCFRGHRHCGRCRGEKRLESRRAAKARHQASFDGRVDQARRQAEYRAPRSGRIVKTTGFADGSLGQRLRVLARFTHTGESLGLPG